MSLVVFMRYKNALIFFKLKTKKAYISRILKKFNRIRNAGLNILFVTPPKGGENRKPSESKKQQDNTESAQYISNKQVSKYCNVVNKTTIYR